MGVMNTTNQQPSAATIKVSAPNKTSHNNGMPSEKLEEARRLYNEGKGEHQAGKHDVAVELFTRSVQLHEVILGKYHQETIKTYWRLGRAAAYDGQDQKSLEAFHRAMRMADTTFDDLVVQSVLSDVESCWHSRTKNEEPHDDEEDGNAGGEEGVEVSNTTEGDNDDKKTTSAGTSISSNSKSPSEDLAQILVLEKQADLCCKKRDFRKAVESYQEALDLLKKWVGEDLTLDGADLNVKKATCDLRVSNTEDALSALKAAQDCYLRQLGAEHPATLGAAANLKTVQRMGRDKMVNKTKKSGGWFSASLSSLVGSENKE
mmetsp:Transcript_405/g.1014  ORF Transcript_405/g.1014 Transcript_405/m.1014 type:complete len:318 (+) Transcript_405:249-1202(+)